MSDLGVRLVKGARAYDLNAADECLTRRDFVPPMTLETPLIAAGNARSDGRGSLVSKKPSTRTWSFTVRLLGDSGAEVQARARALRGFLAQAGDEAEPLYVEMRTSTDVLAPLWGQHGAPMCYEVVHGAVELSDDYALATRRKRAINATLQLTIQPYALGQKQRLCSATGGMLEDTVGSVDGRSRGVMIPEGTTNKMTNPVFGHSTWNNNWTAGSSLTAEQNTDERWLIPGTVSSAKLTSAASSNNTFTQSINVGNTNKHSLSCYARLRYGGVISSTQVQLYYSTAQTTTFTALGNGWYRLTAENVTGINAGTATGVVVKNGYSVYIVGFQIEEKTYATPIGWGDMVGWAWTGTAHASTSARTAAACKMAVDMTTLNAAEGSVRIVARFDVANTHANDMYLFDTRDGSHTSAFFVAFESSDDKFYFLHGGTSTASAAQTFAAGTTYVIHATWNAAGAALYLNGVQVDTDSYVANALAVQAFIGSDYSSAGQFRGAIAGCATFERALSSTEVAADYADIAPLVAEGAQVESVPWLWTDDGDGVLGLDTGKHPLGYVCGVPGSVPAVSEIQGELSSNWSVIRSIILSNYATRDWITYTDLLFDQSGSAGAGDYGGQHSTSNVTGSGYVLGSGTISARETQLLHGAAFIIVGRLFGDSAAAINIYSDYSYASRGVDSTSKTITLASGSAYRMFYTPGNVIDIARKFTGFTISEMSAYLYASKIATNVNVSCDYMAVLPGEVVIMGTAGGASVPQWAYKGITASQGDHGSSLPMTVTGSMIEFAPEQVNHLQCYMCPNGDVDPLTTYVTTISAIYITPRWALI